MAKKTTKKPGPKKTTSNKKANTSTSSEIVKLKMELDQSKRDIKGYENKIKELNKMISHLNKEINVLTPKKNPVRYIAKYTSAEFCKEYIKQFCNDPNIIYDHIKIADRHFVVTAQDL